MELDTSGTEGANLARTSEVASGDDMLAEGATSRGRRRRGNSDRGPPVVGCYVTKNFADGSGTLLGKVVSCRFRYFAAVYEDGRREELELCEIRRMLLPSSPAQETPDEELVLKKKKLEEILSEGTLCTRSSRRKVDPPTVRASGSAREPSGPIMEEDVDSSTDSSESIIAPPSVTPSLPSQPLTLPPSSGNIGVPEESVGCLLSVYSFLRTFSVRLFLSPFSLSDFVGSLICVNPNSLLDAIHLSLMRALRRHLEVLSSEGSQAASRCLRCLNWAMLDALTWPVYVLEYLCVMGWIAGPDWRGFKFGSTEEEEYYSLPTSTKLRNLQILCDAVLDSNEFRMEVDMREETTEEGEYASDIPLPRVPEHHGRHHSRVSALEESTSSSNNLLAEEADLLHDKNSDECRLCGMDGTLICCDSCPSAYHSRCIGLIKASLPEGLWYCPECMVDQMKVGTGIRGAELFGTDPYGRVFIGTCNFLLVLEASTNVRPECRYYYQDDVRKVLELLCSAEEYAALYADICREIARHWLIPVNENCLQTVRAGAALQQGVPLLCPSTVEAVERNGASVDRENASNVSQIALDGSSSPSNLDGDLVAGVFNEANSANPVHDPSKAKIFLGKATEKLDSCALAKGREHCQSSSSTLADGAGLCEMLPQHIDQDSDLLSSRSFSQPTGLTDLIHQRPSDKSSMLVDLASSLGNGTVAAFRDDADSQVSPSAGCGNHNIAVLHVSGQSSREDEKNKSSALLGAAFHPQAYVNQYALGEVAASSAANLAALDQEEGNNMSAAGVSSSLSHRRKVVSANIAMQLKAFMQASVCFIWTGTERRFLDGPRERCGWCISCKGAAVNKKGCLMNLASANVAKTAVIKGNGNTRHMVKSSEKSCLSAVAAHISNMEGYLCSLLIPPLADAKHAERWRILVREASSCRILRSLLLELEKSIRSVAFAPEWFRPFDDFLVDHPARKSISMPVQKRGPGRPRKKPVPSSESIPVPDSERLINICWRRGGRFSRIFFQRGLLPCPLAKKAARQGGVRHILGVNYSANSCNLRTQQLAWRAAVEMSRSASQLALQVRRLDAHIRWKDLVRPEMMHSEISRGAESEASAFRNVVVCGKEVLTGSKTRYALAFGDRKHLPLCVMKSVLEIETDPNGSGKEKLWFSESNVPLYLIKEHEESVRRDGGVSMASVHHPKELARRFSSIEQLQRRQLNAFRRDIFSYLLCKEGKPIGCSCASCPCDVLLEEAVRCGSCQGYCHMGCLVPMRSGDAECASLCKQCHIILWSVATKNAEHLKNSKGQLCNGAPKMVTQVADKHKPCYGSSTVALPPPVSPHGRQIVSGSPVSDSGRVGGHGQGPLQVNHGLVWRRKNGGDGGEQFRLHHVVPKGGSSDPARRPICVLCLKDYNPSATYIRCERCPNWVHAEAVLLEEKQLPNLVSFKCGKCRRKSWPRCPYEDDPDDHRKKRKKRSQEGVPALPPCSPQPIKVIDETVDPFVRSDMGMIMDMESEPPQTYFSFTELLAAPDDTHLDAQLEDLLPLGPEHVPTSHAGSHSSMPCQICTSSDPPAELTCETCGLTVHGVCMPWATGAVASVGKPWKCDGCRDWE